MDKNRDITRIKREEIRRLKEHLTVLQQRLERYGSRPARQPDLAQIWDGTRPQRGGSALALLIIFSSEEPQSSDHNGDKPL